MRRFHAIEWEDFSWFPNSWRDFGTDFLSFIATNFHIYKSITPKLEKVIEKSEGCNWIDCASGGGSGLMRLAKDLQNRFPDLKITLTDLYPNKKTFERTCEKNKSVFQIELESVNACKLPPKYDGKLRTLFGAFHHFKPKDAKAIIQHAVDTRSPIAIFEPVGRNAGSILSMLFVIPNILILTPFIRPIRWQVLPFIYILPIIPLYVLWDGIASILRNYSVKEMQEMIKSIEKNETFEWEIGTQSSGPNLTYFLVGFPKQKNI